MFFFTMRKLRNSLLQSPGVHPETKKITDERTPSLAGNILRIPDDRGALQKFSEEDLPLEPGKHHRIA
jgi:hypothetical protein